MTEATAFGTEYVALPAACPRCRNSIRTWNPNFALREIADAAYPSYLAAADADARPGIEAERARM
jgi:hypothetical protein